MSAIRSHLIALRPIILAATLAIAAATAVAFVWTPRADAHAVQLNARPAPNEQLLDPPTRIAIDFSEPLERSVTSVQLWDTTPAEIDLGELDYPDDESIVVDVPETLPPGIYTVIWRNLSTVDGHTWAGSYSFTVLGPGGQVPAGAVPPSLQALAEVPSNTPSTLDTTTRWVVLLGSAVMLGGVAYVLLVVLPATRVLSTESGASLRRLSITILSVTTLIAVFLVLQGSLIQLVTQADRLGGLGKTDELLTDTRFGKYLIARQGLLAAALLATLLAWRAKAGAALLTALLALLVVSFGVLFTQSMVSHAAGADGAFWKITADLLHLTTAALWIGGLVHVGLAMPRWQDELRDTPRTLFAAESFRRFSVLAAFSVLILMVSGVMSAFAQFTSFEQLYDTNYGRSLLGKMGAMLPLLAAAGLNAFLLQPRIVRAGLSLRGASIDDGPAASADAAGLQRLLANTVRVEAVLAILVLVAVGVLTQLEPARAEAEAKAAAALQAAVPDETQNAGERGYFLEATQIGGLVVSLSVNPAEVGLNEFEIGLGSEFGNVGEVLLVRLDFDHEDPAIGPSSLELPLSGSAKFSNTGTNLSLPGLWEIEITIRRRGQDDLVSTFTVPVGLASEGGSSIWDWPFDGARSIGAVIALSVGAAGLIIVAGWQYRNIRGRRA